MKEILILGASSQIGMALANEFALGNSLLLVGRDIIRLQHAARICNAAGAAKVELVSLDLEVDIQPLLQACHEKSIDLVIDAASAVSSKRDTEIRPMEISGFIAADLISRTELLGQILFQQDKMPAVLYISTVLTLVKSPERVVYTSLKSLYESYLQMLKAENPDFRLLVVYVGTLIDTKEASAKARKLATAVANAYHANRDSMLYGLTGRIFLWLFYLQPLVFFLVSRVQRKVRNI